MTPQESMMAMFGQFKKGIYTSEFWLVAVASVWTAVQVAIEPGRPFSEQAVNLAIIGGSALYAAARSYLKGKRVIATAVISTGLSPADVSRVIQVDEQPPTPTDTTTPPPITP